MAALSAVISFFFGERKESIREQEKNLIIFSSGR